VQIRAIELLSSRPVVAITVNHEGMTREEIPAACEAIRRATGLPACDPLVEPMDDVVRAVLAREAR